MADRSLYVTACGLGTSPIPVVSEILEIEFDFLSHRLVARIRRGDNRELPLEPQTVADLYRRVIDILNGIGVAVPSTRCRTRCRTPSAVCRITPTLPMIPLPPIGSGARSCRPIMSSRSFEPGSGRE
jgi:hypothetical protein